MIDVKQDTCPSCGKTFSFYIEDMPTKMDNKRETYYDCPYCNVVCGYLILRGNEEVYHLKVEDEQ